VLSAGSSGLALRDRTGTQNAEWSKSTTLSQLPSTWTTGSVAADGALSVTGQAG
jgi:hypothetical protein